MAPLTPEEAPLAALPVWFAGRPADLERTTLEAARFALEAAAADGAEGERELCLSPWVAEVLALDLARQLPRVVALVAEGGSDKLARYLEPRHPQGPLLAERTRDDGHQLTVVRTLVRVAYALWWERVQADCLERARRRAQPVALPLAYLEAAYAAYLAPGRSLAPDGSGALWGAGGRPVARVSADLLPGVAVELAKAGGVTPLRLFRWALREVWRRWTDFNARPEALVISGGRSALAEAIGAHHRREVTAALRLGQGLVATGRGWTLGGLWTWSNYRGNRHHGPGSLRLTLAPELIPGSPLRKLTGRDQYLVPLVEREPPLVGSRGEHGAQLALQHVFLSELRIRARELSQYGGISLDLEGWARLGDTVRLRTPLPCVLGAWRDGAGNSLPWLAEPERGLWTLADDLAPLIRFILEGEKRSRANRARGRRSAEVRARRGGGR